MSSTHSGSYTLTSSVAAAEYTNDAEPNDVYTDATVTIAENDSVFGHIGFRRNGGTYDAYDWYNLNLDEDAVLQLLVTNNTGEYIGVALYDSNGTTSLSSSFNYGYASVTVSNLAAGSYYAKVDYGSSSHYASYKLEYITTQLAYPNDIEPNNVYTEATVTIPENDSVFGHIGYRGNGTVYDTDDWYILNLEEDAIVQLFLSNTVGDHTGVYLYDNDGITSLGENFNYGSATVTISNLSAGTYYAKVDNSSTSHYSAYKLKYVTTQLIYPNDAELNDLYTEASVTIPENDSVYGHIGYRRNGGTYDTDDWYILNLEEDAVVKLLLTNTETAHNYMGIYLYDSDGTTSLASNFNYGSTSITVSNLAAGTYYAKVDNSSSSHFSAYKLQYITTQLVYPNDVEPNDLYTEATVTIPENDSVFGHIGYRWNGGTYDTDDWYVLNLSEDGAINLSLSNQIGDYIGVYLYDNNGTTSLGDNFNYGYATVTVSNLAAGTYYAKVDNSSTSHYSPYKLQYLVTPDPYDNDPEPNDSLEIATPMLTNTTVEGHIGFRWNGGTFDQDDYYELHLSEPGSLTVSIEKPGGKYGTIYILNSAGTSLVSATGYGNQSITKPALEAGTYSARVYYSSSSHFTGYTLTNTYCPDAIT
ncbi:MAG: hypothetical protein WAU24_10865, partial [Chitinophagaceae bacterium]